MLLLWFLLIPSTASFKCFSSFKKASVVASSNEICGVEVNAYNLNCLQPTIVALHDVETMLATTVKNGVVGCRIEGHYLKCGCNTDDCNKKWQHSWISSFNRQNAKNNKIFDCITSKCNGGSCEAFGGRGVKAFNHYAMPMNNIATPKHTKPTIITSLERALLWVISGFLLLLWLLVIIASFTFGGGLRPNNGRNTPGASDELPPIDGVSTNVSGASGTSVNSQKAPGASTKPSQTEATTKSKK